MQYFFIFIGVFLLVFTNATEIQARDVDDINALPSACMGHNEEGYISYLCRQTLAISTYKEMSELTPLVPKLSSKEANEANRQMLDLMLNKKHEQASQLSKIAQKRIAGSFRDIKKISKDISENITEEKTVKANELLNWLLIYRSISLLSAEHINILISEGIIKDSKFPNYCKVKNGNPKVTTKGDCLVSYYRQKSDFIIHFLLLRGLVNLSEQEKQ